MSNKKNKYSFDQFKKDFIHFVDRRQHNLDSNLRLASLGLAIILFIGIFQPLIGIETGLSLQSKNTGIDKLSNKELSIYDANIEITNLNVGQMAMQKPLRDYEFFGTKLGEINVFGINLYDLAKTTFPDGSKLGDLSAQLNADWLKFLSTPEFESLIRTNLADYADMILSITNGVAEYSKIASSILAQGSMVMDQLHNASLALNSAIASAENAINVANMIALVILLLIPVSIVLLLIKKGPRYLPAILISIDTFIFLVLGIGIAITNGIINGALTSMLQELNNGIRTFLEANLAEIYTATTSIVDLNQINFVVKFDILLLVGYWTTMITLLGITFIAYFLPARANKLNKKPEEVKERKNKTKDDTKEITQDADNKQSSESNNKKETSNTKNRAASVKKSKEGSDKQKQAQKAKPKEEKPNNKKETKTTKDKEAKIPVHPKNSSKTTDNKEKKKESDK